MSSVLQGKRHQQNLAKRAAREAQDAPIKPAPKTSVEPRKTVKIGKPGYRVTKLYDQHRKQRHLLFQVSPGSTSRSVHRYQHPQCSVNIVLPGYCVDFAAD